MFAFTRINHIIHVGVYVRRIPCIKLMTEYLNIFHFFFFPRINEDRLNWNVCRYVVHGWISDVVASLKHKWKLTNERQIRVMCAFLRCRLSIALLWLFYYYHQIRPDHGENSYRFCPRWEGILHTPPQPRNDIVEYVCLCIAWCHNPVSQFHQILCNKKNALASHQY